MKHDEAQLACSKRLDEELDTETQTKLDDHLSSCEECRRFASEISGAVGVLGAAAPLPPAGLHDAIMTDVRRTPQAAASAAFSRWVYASLAGAAAVAAYFLYAILSPTPAPKPVTARQKSPPPVRETVQRTRPSSALRGLAKRNQVFRAIPPYAVKPPLVFRGSPGPQPDVSESPVFKEFVKAGVPESLRTDEHIRLFESLLRRREKLASLINAGKIVESNEGLLQPKEPGTPLKPVEKEFVDEENADRRRLFEIDAEALAKNLNIPKDEALEIVHSQFAESHR